MTTTVGGEAAPAPAGDEATETYVYEMPSLGADMDEGTVVEWFVGPGDDVHRGDVVARVETEKSDIDIEIWVDGVVEAVEVGPHRTVAVGTPLLLVEVGAGHAGSARSERSVPVDTVPESRPVEVPPRPVADGSTARVAASPRARRLAEERGIDLSAVRGTGPDGAVRAADLPDGTTVHAPVEPTPADSADAAVVASPDLSRPERMRLAIADRMSRSNAEIPHYRLERLVDLSALVAHLDAHNAEVPIAERVVPTAAFVRATASALARHEPFNGTWSERRFVRSPSVDVAVAISQRRGGLLAPTIVDADQLDLVATMERLKELTAAVRSGVIRDQWFAGTPATTVTSLADRGPDVVHGMITVPQTSLVGFGRIADRPIVVDGVVVARPTVVVSLDADHRATDGADGGRFIDDLAALLESVDL